jgi:putative CocE/NonD family hydrolase
MRDGVKLATDIYFPASGAGRLPGRFPVVLERTPYDKILDDRPGSARHFARHGYVAVVQDCRGRFKSEGVHVQYKNEPYDGYDTIEWIAAQRWCNGRVGTTGLSYGAAIQGATGGLHPPHLKSMIPAMGFSYIAQVRKRMGGAARLSTLIREFRQVIDSQEALANPKLREHFIEQERNIGQWLRNLPLKRGHNPFSLAPSYEADIFDLMQKSEWDPEYQCTGYDVTPYYDQYSDADVLLIGGWYDSHIPATLEAYRWLAGRKRQRVRLLMGPWNHGKYRLSFAGDVEFGEHAAINYEQVRLEWFDRTLRAEPMDDSPPIKVFIMGGGGGRRTPEGRLNHGGTWDYATTWPLPGMQTIPHYLHRRGALSPQPPEDSLPTTYQFDPRNPAPTIGGPTSAAEKVIPGGGFNQVCRPDVFGARDTLPLAARHDVCVFQTEPLEEDTLVAGPLEMVLYASSDCVDTDFTAKLVDVYPPNDDYPAGYALNIQDGIVRARYRNRREPPDFIEPGKVYEYRIGMFATANVFKRGHRIRVDISSSNFPRFDVNPNTGEPLMANGLWRVATNSIYHDSARPSHLLLPVVR